MTIWQNSAYKSSFMPESLVIYGDGEQTRDLFTLMMLLGLFRFLWKREGSW
jgi:hypothetical protein